MIVSSKSTQETDVRGPKKSCPADGFVTLGRKAAADVIKEGEENDERNKREKNTPHYQKKGSSLSDATYQHI